MRYIEPSSDTIAELMLGRGGVPVYSGSLSQSGYGFGRVINYVTKDLIPLMKKRLKGHATYAMKQVVKDILRFRNPKSSAKWHAKKEARYFAGNMLKHLGKEVWKLGGKKKTPNKLERVAKAVMMVNKKISGAKKK